VNLALAMPGLWPVTKFMIIFYALFAVMGLNIYQGAWYGRCRIL